MSEKERWDRFAENQQAVFRLGANGYNESLLSFWKENGMLPRGAKVIDLGCGVGKYGTYLARMGCDVTLVDISGEMLRRAEANMAPYSTPWRVFRCNFHEADLSHPVFAGGFDLAICTMSPAVSDTETVLKMSSITRGCCFISRFCEWHQPLRDLILAEVSAAARPLHDDTESDCSSMIRFVKEAGFEPQVRYADYNWTDERTPEQMSAFLLDRYYPDSEDRQELCDELLCITKQHAGSGGTLNDAVYTRAAWIWWYPKNKR